jgi:hypothetical protein
MAQNQWMQYENLKLEYTYKEFQRKIIKNLLEKKKNDLERYKTKTYDYPRLIRFEDQEHLVHQNTILLKNAHEFWQKSQEVTEFIKPILCHYSFQQFSAFFIYSMFKWPMRSSGHGMSCLLNKGIPEIMVYFKEKGFFKRLIDTFIILGYPTAYGSWIPFVSKDGVSFKENNVSLRMPTGRISVIDILDFKPFVFKKEFEAKYPDAFYDRGLDYRLTDYLVVFIASNIARYRPSLWRTIIDGRGEIESHFNQRIRTAYTNYAEGVRSYLYDFWLILAKWSS